MRTPDSLVHKAPFPALANPRVSSAGLRMSGPARRLQALDHQTWIAARRATPPPRCLTLSFCQGSTPILVLQPKKRLAFDSGAEARQRTFSEPERFSNPDKLGECEVLDSGVEGRFSGIIPSGVSGSMDSTSTESTKTNVAPRPWFCETRKSRESEQRLYFVREIGKCLRSSLP